MSVAATRPARREFAALNRSHQWLGRSFVGDAVSRPRLALAEAYVDSYRTEHVAIEALTVVLMSGACVRWTNAIALKSGHGSQTSSRTCSGLSPTRLWLIPVAPARSTLTTLLSPIFAARQMAFQ